MAKVSRINQVISEKMRDYGYTQQKMAVLLGYTHQAAICQKLSGKRAWTLDDVLMICELFNIERFDELF